MRTPKILVVEDEPDLAEPILEGLHDEGFEAKIASSGESAIQLLSSSWDLIILDLMLPGMSGESVLRFVHQSLDHPPVIVLTARSGLHDKLALFRLGCDDYVTKPFEFEELLERVRALLRRGQHIKTDNFQYEDMVLDLAAHQLLVGGEKLALTPKEAAICRLLMGEPGRVVTRKELLNSVWGLKEEQESNFLGVHMFNLKRKLAQCGREDWLQTVRAAGFALSRPGMAHGS